MNIYKEGINSPPLQSNKLVIGSMDVDALYPNCKANTAANSIEECFRMAKLNFDNIDKSLLIGVVSVLRNGDCGDIHLNEFLMMPKHQTTLRSYLKQRLPTQFTGPPSRPHTDLAADEVKTLLGIFTAECTKTTMNSHYFTINEKIYRQVEGCPIGLDLSVEAASLLMLLWDKKFLSKVKRLGIKHKIYKRYVDDIFKGLYSINSGWHYCGATKKMKFDLNHPTANMEPDARTFSILADIANSIDTDIRMTFDVPSFHSNQRLPVLDMELFVTNNIVNF